MAMTRGDGSPGMTVGSGGGDLCACGFGLLLFLGLTALCLWLSLRPNEPKCSVTAFIVPELNKTSNATTNSAIIFMVDFDNGNKESGIPYDSVNFTVGVFLDRNSTSPIGSSTIAGFYQGREKNAKKWSSVETHAGALNRTAKMDGKAYFRVNFTTSVKYKIMFFYTSRHRLWGGANVAVNDAGLKDEKDDIRLGHSLPITVSGATQLEAGCYLMPLVLALFVHFVPLSFFLWHCFFPFKKKKL